MAATLKLGARNDKVIKVKITCTNFYILRCLVVDGCKYQIDVTDNFHKWVKQPRGKKKGKIINDSENFDKLPETQVGVVIEPLHVVISFLTRRLNNGKVLKSFFFTQK